MNFRHLGQDWESNTDIWRKKKKLWAKLPRALGFFNKPKLRIYVVEEGADVIADVKS